MTFLRYPHGANHSRSLRVRRESKSHDCLKAEETNACQKENVSNHLLVFVRSSETGSSRAVQEIVVTTALRQQGGGDCGVQVVSDLQFKWKRSITSRGISLLGCSPYTKGDHRLD